MSWTREHYTTDRGSNVEVAYCTCNSGKTSCFDIVTTRSDGGGRRELHFDRATTQFVTNTLLSMLRRSDPDVNETK